MNAENKMRWTDAIMKVLHKHDGAATLDTLHADIAKLNIDNRASDVQKVVRGYLWRLKDRGTIKRIGLATYALADFQVENDLFGDIMHETVAEKEFVALPGTQLHGYLQGMLIEIGNMRNFETYTPDKSVVFNGKKLSDVASCARIPPFTYADRLKKIAQIDVIWFKDGYPIKTFDIENSTDFTKALVRSYQLKYFKTECFMVADTDKQRMFDDRVTTPPFNEIKDGVKLLLNASVFHDYRGMLQMDALKKQSPIL